MSNAEVVVGVDARSLLCKEPRGEGKSLLRLYQEIALIEPGIRLIFFGDEHALEFGGELPPRTAVERLSSRGSRFDTWQNLRLPWAAMSHRCDVLHCTSSGGPAWSATPMLMTVHDLIPMLVDDGQAQADRVRFRRSLTRGLARAKAVIAVSQNTRNDLARAFPKYAHKYNVVHWGAPTQSASSAAQSGSQRSSRYVLAFGGTAPRKNTFYTLERFAAIAAKVEALRLVFVGISSAVQRAQIEQHAAHLDVAGRVDMPGFVEEAQLQRLLQGAEAVLYLSRYEGFGLPLLEAVAHGVPVVASDASSIPEVLSDGGSCYPLDAPGEIEGAILRIAMDPQHRQHRIREQARVTARFDWHDTATKTLALLREVAAGSRVR